MPPSIVSALKGTRETSSRYAVERVLAPERAVRYLRRVGASKNDRATLHLGSGLKYIPGATNVDVTAAGNPDVVHDLNVRPWPFETSSFDDVHAYDVLEHLEDVLRTIEEIPSCLSARWSASCSRPALLERRRVHRPDSPAITTSGSGLSTIWSKVIRTPSIRQHVFAC